MPLTGPMTARFTGYGDGTDSNILREAQFGLRASTAAQRFSADNLRAPALEARDGRADAKPVTALCARVLFLWREMPEFPTRLSSDHGRTWSWADWKFTNSFAVQRSRIMAETTPQSGWVAYVYSRTATTLIRSRPVYHSARASSGFANGALTSFFKEPPRPAHPMDKRHLCAAAVLSGGACYRPSVTFAASLTVSAGACRPNERSATPPERSTRGSRRLSITKQPAVGAVVDGFRPDAGMPARTAPRFCKWISSDDAPLPCFLG